MYYITALHLHASVTVEERERDWVQGQGHSLTVSAVTDICMTFMTDCLHFFILPWAVYEGEGTFLA